MRCWLPRLPEDEALCPASLLSRWCAARDARWGSAPEGPLFCVAVGRPLRPMSYASFRRAVADSLCDPGVGTHSLRKGGAKWWKERGLPEEVVQAQGAWASAETMRAFYTRFSDE